MYINIYIYIYILFIYIVLVLSFLDLTTLCVSSAHFLFTNKCFKGEANLQILKMKKGIHTVSNQIF